MKQLIFVLLFVCGVVCAHGGFRPIKFRNCKSEFEVLSVEASDCDSDDSNKCPFKRNTEPTIRIGFKPNRNVNSLKANVRAKLEGGADSKSFVSFALENENACQGSNITCPLVEGKTYFYSQSVKVAKEYPLVDVQVNWLIVDPENSDSSKREICIIFLAKSGNTLMMLFLCTLFAQILIYGETDNPMKLWDDFKEDLAEDFILHWIKKR